MTMDCEAVGGSSENGNTCIGALYVQLQKSTIARWTIGSWALKDQYPLTQSMSPSSVISEIPHQYVGQLRSVMGFASSCPE